MKTPPRTSDYKFQWLEPQKLLLNLTTQQYKSAGQVRTHREVWKKGKVWFLLNTLFQRRHTVCNKGRRSRQSAEVSFQLTTPTHLCLRRPQNTCQGPLQTCF